MKVSKLFHWLYASLMLLPLGFIGGTTLYTIFNPNAKDSFSASQSPDTYLSDDTITFLKKDYVYQFTTTDSLMSLTPSGRIYVSQIVNIRGLSISLEKIPNYFENYINQNGRFIHVAYTDSTHSYLQYANTSQYSNVIQFNFVPNQDYNSSIFTYSDWVKNVVFGTQQSLDNAFVYSINKVNDNSIFSWAQNSFLAQPLLYITNLFGIPSTSPIITLLSYWLAISIIWLVFDLIMYVPLLVHRWIDKGVLE